MSELDQLVAELNKKYKKKIIHTGSELKKVEFIPYSSPKMNWLTHGGVPIGRMIQFAGVGGGGKTTSALDVIANFQKMFPDKYSVYLDAENTLDKDWGEALGVDWSRVILIRPENEYGELLLDMVIDAVKTGVVGLVVIDSVPFLIPKAVWEEDMEKQSMGGNSKMITAFCFKFIPLMNKHKVTTIIINQVRDKFNSMYTAYNLPCGKALYHSCSQIMFFSKGGLLDENGTEHISNFEHPVGHIVNVKIEKNKVTKGDRKLGNYTLSYFRGVDILIDTVDIAIQIGVILQGGAWFTTYLTTGEEFKVQGKAKIFEMLKNDPEEFKFLYQRVYEALVGEV